MKIAILTLAIGDSFKERMHYAMQSKREYCKKHGYDLIDDETVYDTSRPIAWSKILLIKKYLPMYDVVVWIDADAIILDMSQTLENKLELMNGKDICVTTVFGMINTGVMLIRNSDRALALMDLIYTQTQYINDGNWEQSAFIHIYEKNIEGMADCIHVLDEEHMRMQCYLPSLKPGMFVLHMAGFRPEYYGWLVTKIFRKLYPLQREDETDQQYWDRMVWYQGKIEEAIYGFYNISPDKLVDM